MIQIVSVRSEEEWRFRIVRIVLWIRDSNAPTEAKQKYCERGARPQAKPLRSVGQLRYSIIPRFCSSRGWRRRARPVMVQFAETFQLARNSGETTTLFHRVFHSFC